MRLAERLKTIRTDLVHGRVSDRTHELVVERTAADEVRPGWLSRAVGVDVALVVQLILLVIELVRQVKDLREKRG